MLKKSSRNHGLDLIRVMAILLVFFSHFKALTGHKILGPLSEIGGIGVDLFFVLSGYLIGHQIFQQYVQSQKFSLSAFYIKRFFRTWPNYFFILILYYSFPLMRERNLITPLWKFLTFTQNFGLKPSAYSHAWSLCIEEQFYFFLPLLILTFHFLSGKNLKKFVQMFYVLLIGIFLWGFCWRHYQWYTLLRNAKLSFGPYFTTYIYYPTFGRLDGLVSGISLAFLQNFNSRWWKKMTSGKVLAYLYLLFGFAGYAFVYYIWQGNLPNWQYASSVIVFPLVAVSSSCFILSALVPGFWLQNLQIWGVFTLANLSFAFYLVHKQIIHILGLFSPQSYHQWYGAWMAFLLALLAAFLIYYFIERIFLNLRQKIISYLSH